MFAAKRLLWFIKDEGQSWNVGYLSETVLFEKVVPFFHDEHNVVSVGETKFVLDRKPCMKANATQLLLREQGLKFWVNEMWPWNSPWLEPDRKSGRNRERSSRTLDAFGARSWKLFERNLEKKFGFDLVWIGIRSGTFEDLLCSMPRRFQQVRKSNGGETEYWILTITFIFENFGRFLFFVNKMARYWYYKLKHSLLNAELNSLQDRIRISYVSFTQFAVGGRPDHFVTPCT